MDCMQNLRGNLSAWIEALPYRLEISLLLWIATVAGIFLLAILSGRTSLSVRFNGFLRRKSNGLGQPQQTSDGHVTGDKAVSDASENSKGLKLASSTIQIDDLVSFHQKLHYKDGGPPWKFLTERSIPGMTYNAWRRDPQEGPTEYRNKFVFEDVTPQMMTDFLWDDELRHEWDNLIKSAKCVEGRSDTGESITHWIKKFPFFCSDREYVMVRRIYQCEGIFYCITKASSHKDIPIKKTPRRVQVYSSSWRIQAVQSVQTGQMTSCEVTLLHSEDLLIQRDLAKLGVRRAVWPLVKRMEPGLRKYQAYSKSPTSSSLSSSLASVCTSVPSYLLNKSSTSGAVVSAEKKEKAAKDGHVNACKWVVIGGILLLAYGLGGASVARVILLGAAKGLGRFRRK